jgi:16S rRNA (cytosine967-C5)-methyltransferase
MPPISRPGRQSETAWIEIMTLPVEIARGIEALELVLDFQRPADACLSAFFRQYPKLGSRERAFIAEAVYGVLRHLRSLQEMAAPSTPRRLMLAWLARHAGYTLRQMAVLVKPRELAWVQAIKEFKLDEAGQAVQLELPDWLFERLREQYGERLVELLGALNRPAPLDLRANLIKTDREAALAALHAAGLEAEATPYSPLGIRMADKTALQSNPLFVGGDIEVQDEGSQLLALLVNPKRGEMVCDFCAGAGGKTLALGALMHNSGRLYAFDVADKRLAKLKPRLARSGLSNVHPQLIADERDQKIKRLAGKFDRVLVDAPCSGLGTLRRNPDLKWRQSEQSVTELTAKQAAILASASRLVKPGGRLVYATCSLLKEENEEVVVNFLAEHSAFKLLPANALLAAQKIELDTGEMLRLDPARHGTDGFFAAVLERSA